MKRVSLRAVVEAVSRLQALTVPKSAAALPGFFALKAQGADVGSWVKAGGTEFADLAEKLYEVPGAGDRPYFDPLTGGWKKSNWPRGSVETSLKRDSTPIRRDGKLTHQGSAENREWMLHDGYVGTLHEYVPAERVPALPFAIWASRGVAMPDDMDAAGLITTLRGELNLTAAEFDAIFDSSMATFPDPLWTDTDWPISDLLEALPSPTDVPGIAGAEADDGDQPDLPQAPPPDSELVANLVKFLQQDELFEVSEELVRNVLYSLRVDRIAILVGKPGTGKTEFVRAFSNGLARAGGTPVHLVETPVTEETAEFDLIGYRDLAGNYVPSRVMQELNRGNSESDLYVLLLDEFNLATVDAYGAKLISGITNRLAIDLPGSQAAVDAKAWYPQSGRWMPHNGLLIMATMNSYLEDPSRKQLSVPIKRRSNLISMPDPVLELVQTTGATDEPPSAFGDLCRMALDQSVRRLRIRGTSVIDGSLLEQLAAPVPADVVALLWRLSRKLSVHDEVPMTLGLIQSILKYIQTSDFADPHTALDVQVEQKVLPVLRGAESLLDEVVTALGPGDWPRTTQAIRRMRRLASENAGRLRPLA